VRRTNGVKGDVAVPHGTHNINAMAANTAGAKRSRGICPRSLLPFINTLAHKKAAELLSSHFPVPSRKIAFLFGKA
jgi:hypothetical protein